MDNFLQKLYGPAISQSDCRKAGPYQLTYNKPSYQKYLLTMLHVRHLEILSPQLFGWFKDSVYLFS